MTKTPREQFFSGPHKVAFESYATTESFREAGRMALLEFISTQTMTPDLQKHWDAYSQLIGARRFWAILCSMHEKPELPQREKEPSLHYKDKG